MERPWILDYDTANCSIGAAVKIIGERQTFLVLREAFNGVRRFDDMQRRTAIPREYSATGWPAWSTRACSARFPIVTAASAAATSTGSPTRGWTCTRCWWR